MGGRSAVLSAGTAEEKKEMVLEEMGTGTGTGERRTISAKIVWFHLKTLLERSQMDTFFVSLGRLCTVSRGPPYANPA